jgi:hypothetical protein
MRSNRAHVTSALVMALGLVSARAAAEEPAAAEPATEPAARAPAAATQPTPRVAAVPAAGARATPATWQEGFMLVPMIGINSFQGDSGQGTGPGLRLGLLAGARLTELLSLNVGFAFDLVNLNVPPGADAGRYVFDIGFNPLFHFPLQKFDIVAGPLAGVFLDYGTVGGGGFSVDTWAYGWTAGVNAGVLFPVGSKVRLGGLANFYLRNPSKVCVTANGTDTCASSGVDSVKTLALSFAALL